MLYEVAQATKRRVGPTPVKEARLDRGDDVIKGWKVVVMKTRASNQFPNALDGVEFWAVGREEMQSKVTGYVLSPLGVKRGVMVTRVVGDDHDFTIGASAAAFKTAQEVPARLRVEHSFGARHDELAVAQPHRAEVADALARGSVPAHRIGHLGRNPHAAARSVLLEVHFIHSPQVNVLPSCQRVEFFYAPVAIRDPLERLEGVVCAAENPTGERGADTVAL